MSGVIRQGGVVIGGGSAPVGQPSPAGQVRPDVRGFRVPFDRDKFTQILKAHGYPVKWEKAIMCPARRGQDARNHDFSCKSCQDGFVYYDAKETLMLVQGISLKDNYYAYGSYDTGKATVTALPEFKISFWDRITLCDSRARFTQIILRQPDTDRDRLKYDPLCVDHLLWKDRTGAFRAYVYGVNFTVDPVTAEIVWVTADRPDANDYYSVAYEHRPRYEVIDLVHQIRDERIPTPSGVERSYEFPVQAVVQMSYTVRDENRDNSDEDNRQNPFPRRSKDNSQGP